MIIHDVDADGKPIEQGSAYWHELRLGVPTASNFHKIITASGKPSSQARGYMARLIAERLLNESMDDLPNLQYVELGKEREPQAARHYAFSTGKTLRQVCFVTTDDGRWGASPDRFIEGENTLLEIKAPKASTHVEYYMDGFGGDYKAQVQGQMLVCEADRAIRYSWHPKLPPVQQMTVRDAPFIGTLRGLLTAFSDELDATMERFAKEGYVEQRKQFADAATLHYADPDDIERTIASYGDHKTIFAG